MLEITFDRKRMLDALAAAKPELLTARYDALGTTLPPAIPVRGPEFGMVMLRGRIGGGGAPFNLGEATVTRATVRLEGGEVGHSVILGRNADKARMVAHLDALSQRPEWCDRIENECVLPALAAQAEERTRRAEETEATRVDFFTMVRGDD
jgi:alpha-D-ribose 1-methylphosphonate 5-triphosphate synthase subunit PhnG